jgi:1-acyl-sn-glycerol-3-phosphate acyltransferase
MLKITLKATALFFALLLFVLGACGIIFVLPAARKRKQALIQWMHHCSKLILEIFDVHFWTELCTSSPPKPGTLFLSNHMSYLDVLILSAQSPSVFVTSVEVKHTPILGLLAKLAGAYFVERRNRSTLRQNIVELRSILESGINVVLFPEGTTTDGAAILPFKKSLLEAVVGSKIPVTPLCINYRFCNGEEIGSKHTKQLFYFGEMKLVNQLFNLLGTSEIVAQVFLLEALNPEHKKCRHVVAEESRNSISQVFVPISRQEALV